MTDTPELNGWREAYAARRDTLDPTMSQAAAAVIRTYGDQRDAAAYERGKLEGARLAIGAAARECTEYEAWHNKHDDGLSGFGHMALGASELRDNIKALAPAKIVGEG